MLVVKLILGVLAFVTFDVAGTIVFQAKNYIEERPRFTNIFKEKRPKFIRIRNKGKQFVRIITTGEYPKLSIALDIIGILLVIAFSIIQITTTWTEFTIFIIVLLIVACIEIRFRKCKITFDSEYIIGDLFTCIGFIFSIFLYSKWFC